MDKQKSKKLHIINISGTYEVKLFEAFAGIGSQRIALNNIANKMNWTIKSLGIIEWFIDAIIAYEVFHNHLITTKKSSFNKNVIISMDSKKPCSKITKSKIINNSVYATYLNNSLNKSNNLFDITNVKSVDLPKDIDIFTYSFPCQDLSNQGLQKGMDKKDKTRSSLLWQVQRILNGLKKEELPKYLLLENVKAILNEKHKPQLMKWIKNLDKLGYNSKIYTLNSLNFNLAQNRVRVFVLSVLKTHQAKVNFEFQDLESIKQDNPQPIKSILDNKYPFETKWNQYRLRESKLTKNNIHKLQLLNYSNFSSESFVFDINYSGPTLTASGALSRIKLYYGSKQIRSMQPDEAFKYMGINQQYYQPLIDKQILTNTKMIYLAGNAIAINVLEAIFGTLRF